MFQFREKCVIVEIYGSENIKVCDKNWNVNIDYIQKYFL